MVAGAVAHPRATPFPLTWLFRIRTLSPRHHTVPPLALGHRTGAYGTVLRDQGYVTVPKHRAFVIGTLSRERCRDSVRASGVGCRRRCCCGSGCDSAPLSGRGAVPFWACPLASVGRLYPGAHSW